MSISPWGPCWQDRAASLTNGRQHQRKLMIAFVKGRVPDHTIRPASQLGAQSCNIAACRLPMIAAIWRDEGGVIAILTALALTLLIGIVGLAVDVGMWDRTNRALQNAADAAVIAAALNGTGSYQNEAKAVAAQYGFVDGVNGITVTALNNQTCPDGATDCYQVTVAQASTPRFFSPVVGLFSPLSRVERWPAARKRIPIACLRSQAAALIPRS